MKTWNKSHDSGESKPPAVVYNGESKLGVLFYTEDPCAAFHLQRRVSEHIICGKLSVIIIGGELMIPVSFRRS
jgi:hypothetical protein